MTERQPIHAVAPDSSATPRPALVPDDQEDALTALALLLNREEFAADVVRDSDNHKLVQTIRDHVTSITREITSRTSRLREGREAHEIQRGLFPAHFPSPASCEIHGSWHPAAEVGGDYYDAIELDDSSIAVCIADVCGKGIPAALLMANLQAAVRTLAVTYRSPAEVCRRVSRLIFDNTPPDKFVTFFYAVLDTSPGTLRYVNAGHLPPLLVRPGEPIARLSEGGRVLGIDKDTAYEEAEVAFAPGDRLVLYTDGLTEAQDLAGEEFGDRRLRELVRRYLGCPLIRFHDALLDEVRGFAGSLQDDAAVLSIDCLAAAAC